MRHQCGNCHFSCKTEGGEPGTLYCESALSNRHFVYPHHKCQAYFPKLAKWYNPFTWWRLLLCLMPLLLLNSCKAKVVWVMNLKDVIGLILLGLVLLGVGVLSLWVYISDKRGNKKKRNK